MAIPFWDSNKKGYTGEVHSSNPWDCLVIGALKTPGYCEIAGTFLLASQKSKPSGAHGARVTVTGKDPQEIDVTIYMWTPDQWDYWQAMASNVCGSDKQTADAFDVYHPALASLGIKSAIILSRSTPNQGRVAGERSVRLRLVEYSPPPAAKNGKAKSATKTITASVREEFQTQPKSVYSVTTPIVVTPSSESSTVGP